MTQTEPGPPARATDAGRMTVAPLEVPLNLLWIVLGIALCVYSAQLGVMGPSGPDSGFFPMMAGVLVAGSGFLLLLQKGSRAPAGTPFWIDGSAARRVCALVVGMFALILMTRYLGFLIASVLMIPVLMWLIEKRSIVYAVVVGLCTTAAVQLVFITLLGMRMPRGLFGF